MNYAQLWSTPLTQHDTSAASLCTCSLTFLGPLLFPGLLLFPLRSFLLCSFFTFFLSGFRGRVTSSFLLCSLFLLAIASFLLRSLFFFWHWLQLFSLLLPLDLYCL